MFEKINLKDILSKSEVFDLMVALRKTKEEIEELAKKNIEELTKEEIEELKQDKNKNEIEENNKKYKAIYIYLQSNEFSLLCKYFDDIWYWIAKEIETQIIERKEAKTTKTQLDKDILHKNILQEFINKLWSSDWEKYIKEYFDLEILLINRRIYWLVSDSDWDLYDTPFYTDIDIEKQKMHHYFFFWIKLNKIMSKYEKKQKEEIENPNPYES